MEGGFLFCSTQPKFRCAANVCHGCVYVPFWGQTGPVYCGVVGNSDGSLWDVGQALGFLGVSWPCSAYNSFVSGSKLIRQGTAGFRPCFHRPGLGFHFAYLFLTHSHICAHESPDMARLSPGDSGGVHITERQEWMDKLLEDVEKLSQQERNRPRSVTCLASLR